MDPNHAILFEPVHPTDDGSVAWRFDLGALRPAPAAPPAEGSQW